MCDSKISRWLSGIGGYFSAPTFGKATPAYATSAAAAMNISLPDIVTTVTLIYTVVLLIGALPGLWKTWDFFRNRRDHKEEKDD